MVGRTGWDGAQIGGKPITRDRGLDEMGLGDEGEWKKMRRKKEEIREAGEREKERKDKIFF